MISNARPHTLTSIIDIGDLQRLQDSFAQANRVASTIIDLDGQLITRIDDATRVAERLRRAILEMSFSFSGKEVTITASFGVSGIVDWHDHDAVCHETLLNSADLYLYRAKHGGRNMVVAGPPIIN